MNTKERHFSFDSGFTEEFLKESELEYDRTKLMGKIGTLRMERKQLCARLAEAEKQIENMRCCGNCSNYEYSSDIGYEDCCSLGYKEEENCLENNLKYWRPENEK